MSALDDIARDIAYRMREDMCRTLSRYHYHHDWPFDPMLDDLVDDAMFQVEHLLVQHACDEQRARVEVSRETEVSR